MNKFSIKLPASCAKENIHAWQIASRAFPTADGTTIHLNMYGERLANGTHRKKKIEARFNLFFFTPGDTSYSINKCLLRP